MSHHRNRRPKNADEQPDKDRRHCIRMRNVFHCLIAERQKDRSSGKSDEEWILRADEGGEAGNGRSFGFRHRLQLMQSDSLHAIFTTDP